MVRGWSGGRERGTVDVERRACVVGLRVDELEPDGRCEVLEQGKPVPECHRLQDEAEFVDEPEPGE